MLDPDRWRKVQEIFAVAVDLPEDQQSAYVEQTCAGEPDILKEVQSLLAYDTPKQSERLSGAVQDEVLRMNQVTDSWVGRHIGPYLLTEVIGLGGMGAVYGAVRDDDQYKKRVAIKVIRGILDSGEIRRRFVTERQILATLEHPNIARLLDGGTTEDGQPYIVMEYVDGRPITTAANDASLSIEQRLRLFLSVCSAVQYAHQNLVVHRDLKPSNILVPADGQPKLLDFGIAKLIQPQPVSPSEDPPTQLIGITPEYSSPEQVKGETISTRTDVYSLGVILYELLSGQRPFKVKSTTPSEIHQVICFEEPQLPSSKAPHPLDQKLKGDLDSIILHALQKDPARRYPSVDKLAEDIERYLSGRPVLARDSTALYRAAKFLRRNRLPVIAASLVVVSLAAGLLAFAYEARRAERRFQQVRKLANVFLFDISQRIKPLSGSTEAQEAVVRTALEYLDNLGKEASGDTDLQIEIATAYEKVGDILGDPFAPNLGRPVQALDNYRRALAITSPIAFKSHNPKILTQTAQIRYNIGQLESRAGNTTKAGEHFEAGLRDALEAHRIDPSSIPAAETVAGGYNHLGDLLILQYNPEKAVQNFTRAAEINRDLVKKDPSPKRIRGLGGSLARLGHAQMKLGDLNGSVKTRQEAIVLDEGLVQRDPRNPQYRRDLMTALMYLAQVTGDPNFPNLGDLKTAASLYARCIQIGETLAAEDPKNVLPKSDLIFAYIAAAGIAKETDPARAVAFCQRALDTFDSLPGPEARSPEILRAMEFVHATWGRSLGKLKRYPEAESQFREQQQIAESLAKRDPARAQFQLDLLGIHFEWAQYFLDQKRPQEVITHLMAGLKIVEPMVKAKPADMSVRIDLAETLEGLSQAWDIQAKKGGPDASKARQESIAWAKKRLALWDTMEPRNAVVTLQLNKAKKGLDEVRK